MVLGEDLPQLVGEPHGSLCQSHGLRDGTMIGFAVMFINGLAAIFPACHGVVHLGCEVIIDDYGVTGRDKVNGVLLDVFW